MVQIGNNIAKLQIGNKTIKTADVNTATSAIRKELQISEFPKVKLNIKNTYQISPENPKSVKDILAKYTTFLDSRYCKEFAPWNKIFHQTKTLF